MKKIYGILCILLCFFLTGCDDDSKGDVGPDLEIAERIGNITAAGGSVNVTLSLEAAEAKSNQSWCTTNVSGKTVTVTVAANPDLEGRTAIITVTKEKESLFFPVTQIGNMTPTPEVNTVNFDANGGIQKIYVDNVSPFTAIPEDDWISAEVIGDTLILTAQTNYTVNTNTTTIKLTSGNLESEMTVTQTGIILTPEITAVLLYNSGDNIRIKINSTLPFTAESSDPTWLTVTTGSDFINLVATDNSGKPERTATVTLRSQGITATIAVTQRAPVYTDYLGNWILKGEDNGNTFTYNLSIVQNTANSTYKITGWGKSIVATDSKYALNANFDAASGLIYITSQENIAVYTDASNVQYDVMYYGQIEMSGKIYYVSGSGYLCYVGMLQRDGSVQWINGEVSLEGGGDYEVVGAKYYIKSRDDNQVRSFNVDSPFMREPLMEKASTSTSLRNIAKVKQTVRIEINQLNAQ